MVPLSNLRLIIQGGFDINRSPGRGMTSKEKQGGLQEEGDGKRVIGNCKIVRESSKDA